MKNNKANKIGDYMEGDVDRIVKRIRNYCYGSICANFSYELNELYTPILKAYHSRVPWYSYKYTNASYWGELAYGIPNGWGCVMFDNGDFYIGEWRRGNRCGLGLYYWSDGSLFLGDSTYGIKFSQGGDVYLGEVNSNHQAHGTGRSYWYTIGVEIEATYLNNQITKVFRASSGFEVTYTQNGKSVKYIYDPNTGKFGEEENPFVTILGLAILAILLYAAYNLIIWVF